MIYFDNAATTIVDSDVKQAIVRDFDAFGNPSSSYDIGKAAKHILNNNRHIIENCLSLPRDSFIFTSGGSEADNFAIKAGFLYGLARGKNKIVISSIEHHAITHAANQMKFFGAVVECVQVNHDGTLNIEDLKRKVDSKTAIVSIMASNNEIGTILDIYYASEIAHRFGAIFHTDAVQGITHMPIAASMVDMFSISGHKFHTPKGIGGLYIEPHLKDELIGMNLINGGGQEFGLRAGTENVPYSSGLATAVTKLVNNRKEKNKYISELNEYATKQLKNAFPYLKFNGPNNLQLKNLSIINVSFGFADAASIVEWCNLYEICIASGSACNTGSNKPSHVLTSIGCSEREAFSSIRVSMSEDNTKEDIDKLITALKAFENRYKID